MDFKIQLPADFSPEERAERARNNFLNGYNCCQSVLLAFSDLLESKVSAELLSIIGSGFGGGMARLREVCGSFSGAVAMAGFISPADDPSVKEARTANYALVQKMAWDSGSVRIRKAPNLRTAPPSTTRSAPAPR